MHSTFEAEKNQKAALYTAIICVILLLLFYFITWSVKKMPPPPPMQDLIEVNLGNEKEGFGKEQPLVKGAMGGAEEPSTQKQQAVAANDEPAKDIDTDDKTNDDAAPVTKIEKNKSKKIDVPKVSTVKPVKTITPSPVVTAPAPKPQKPKATYPGASRDNGNNSSVNNDKFGQGNKPGQIGDAGSISGKPDSYGNNPGGKTAGGALRVSKGDRTIINNYIFMGDLPKATINAIIKVSADGRGTFISFDKGSTSTDPRYASAIRTYLPNIQFNNSDHESVVTVPFNFKVQ
ncbi:MAG: hypothetical protein IPP72_21500 [Chitinophagaceae bacterium]|nr:hypothetical protein [Chitinophagaceae bacterium]